MLRKMGLGRATELDAEVLLASQRMTRLIHSLKPKAQSASSAVPPAASQQQDTR